ncbi:MAG: zinc-ribbon domain-containing protein, partial [Oscillospiraceae bacterium]
MFCENCGKSLIRGYQFCLECGTPVPQETPEEEPAQTAEPVSDGMPGVEPISNSENGKLVFCQNCGMRMQQTTAFCEQCGMPLQNNNTNGSYSNLPNNNGVPLWNTEQIDYGYENISDGDLQQINNFMSGGGIADPTDYSAPEQNDDFGGMAEIGGGLNVGGGLDTLNSQYANLCKSDNENVMPSIGNDTAMINDEVRKVENFAMDTSYVDNSYVDSGALPVIEGASMDFDPNEPEPEDPNAFVMTPEAISDITPDYAAPTYEEPAVEEVAEEVPAIPT